MTRQLKIWTAPCAPNKLNISFKDNSSNGSSNGTCSNERSITINHQYKDYAIGLALAISSGFANAFRYEMFHYAKDVNTTTFNFWLSLGGLAVGLVGAPFQTVALPTTAQCTMYFLGVVLIMYMLLTPYSIRYISPSVYALIRSQQLVVLFFLQLIFSGVFNPGVDNWLEYVGIGLCITACVGQPLLKYLEGRKLACLY